MTHVGRQLATHVGRQRAKDLMHVGHQFATHIGRQRTELGAPRSKLMERARQTRSILSQIEQTFAFVRRADARPMYQTRRGASGRIILSLVT